MYFERLLSFLSIYDSIRAEKLLAAAGIAAEAIPTPREIDISCGQALIFSAAYEAEVLALLKQNRAKWSKLFSRDAKLRVYEKLKDYEG